MTKITGTHPSPLAYEWQSKFQKKSVQLAAAVVSSK